MTIVENLLVDDRKPYGTSVSYLTIKGRSRVRDSVQTPNYASVTFRPLLPENPYSDTQYLTGQVPAAQKVKTVSVWYEWVGVYPYSVYTRRESTSFSYLARGYTTHGQERDALSVYYTNARSLLPSEDVLRNEALTKVLSEISDAKTNLPVLAAEASKTISLITGTANKLYRAMRAVRRGRFGEAAAVLDVTPKKSHNSWLSYKYGWMPLLSDVKNTAELFAQQYYGRQPEFDVKKTAMSEKTWKLNRTNASGWSGGNRATEGFYATADRRYTIKATVRLDNPNLALAQQTGLTNPLLVAWELVPYSFVFDWFIGVGNYLQAISALHGVTIVKAMSSTLNTGRVVQTISEIGYTSGNQTYYPFSTSAILTQRQYSRGPTTISALDIVPVRNRDPWSFAKIVTSAALLKGRIGR